MAKITFEQIEGGATTTELAPAVGNAVLAFSGFGYNESITTMGAVALGGLEITQANLGYVPPTPTWGIGDGELLLLSGYSYGSGFYPPAESSEPVLHILGEGDASVDVGMGTVVILGSAESTTEDDVLDPPVFYPSEQYEIVVESSFSAVSTPSGSLTHALVSSMTLADRFTVFAILQATLTSSAIARDAFATIYEGHIADSVAIEDDVLGYATMIALLADQIVVIDQAIPHLNALVLVASALSLADRVVGGLDANLASEAWFDAEVEARVNALVELASEMTLLDEAEADLLLFAAVDDSFVVGDGPTALVAALAQILDSFAVGVRVRTEAGDEYAGYALNVRNAAVTEYTQYPYNSLAIIDGRLHGAGPRGIYQLEGNTDDGEAITSRLRLGLQDFGTTQLKRVPNAYVGYTSTGQLLLKVITTDKGQKKENHYRLKPQSQAEPGGNRFDIAKGLVGMYWAFEFENVDGADFELDVVKVWPMALNRRYSGR